MPKDYTGQEPTGWFTAKGVHIPLYNGETPDEAIKRLQKQILYDNMTSDIEYNSFGTGSKAIDKTKKKFMEQNSTFELWKENLTYDEKSAINYYTDEEYININNWLYERGYGDLDQYEREDIDNIDSAINKFELFEPIKVTRQANMQMLGFDANATPTKQQIINKLIETYGHMEYRGYLSSSCDDVGRYVMGTGVIVHIGVPGGIGVGAYIASPSLTPTPKENEFLFGRSAVLKYDISSLKKGKNGCWEINAEYVGKAPEEDKK